MACDVDRIHHEALPDGYVSRANRQAKDCIVPQGQDTAFVNAKEKHNDSIECIQLHDRACINGVVAVQDLINGLTKQQDKEHTHTPSWAHWTRMARKVR